MAKTKSFKSENPALRYIPKPQVTADAETPEAKQEKQEQPVAEPAKPEPKAKPATKIVAPGYEKIVDFDGIGPVKRELKSRRWNFVFQPSLVDAIKEAAKSLDMSANDFCAQVLKRYLVERGFYHE